MTDRVVNAGFSPTPHMFFYHVNVGHPCSTRARAISRRSPMWSGPAMRARLSRAGGRLSTAARRRRRAFAEQVWQHEMAADATAEVPVALVNDRLGLGFEVTTRKDQLPCLYQWQNFQAGRLCRWASSLRPITCWATVPPATRGEMIWLGARRGAAAMMPGSACCRRGRDRRRGRSVASAPSPASPPTTIPTPSAVSALCRTCEADRRSDRRTEDRPEVHHVDDRQPMSPRRDYSLTGPKPDTRRRDRPRLGRMVSLGRAAQGDEGADAAPRRTRRSATRCCGLRLLVVGAAGGIALLGHAGGACRSGSSTACSTARPAISRWHECGHGTAFRTPWMNDVVYQIASFMVMRNPVTWRWSHARHHTDTIIVGRDAEIGCDAPAAICAEWCCTSSASLDIWHCAEDPAAQRRRAT